MKMITSCDFDTSHIKLLRSSAYSSLEKTTYLKKKTLVKIFTYQSFFKFRGQIKIYVKHRKLQEIKKNIFVCKNILNTMKKPSVSS